MKELLEFIAKSLVDCPDDVYVTESESGSSVVLELHVNESDMGKVAAGSYIYGKEVNE